MPLIIKQTFPRPLFRSLLMKTGQTTIYNSKKDDGYYQKGVTSGVLSSYQLRDTDHQAGNTNIDLTHLLSDTGAFTAADQKYTDAGKCGVFNTAGGETIVITGSALNNGVFTTTAASANTVTVTAGFVNEPDAPMTTIKKRLAIANATVLDLNTGLEWLQAIPASVFGSATPWAGKMNNYLVNVLPDIYTYADAANAAMLGGYDDWRVPNKNEVNSLFNPVPYSFYFPALATVTALWSSTYSAASKHFSFSCTTGLISSTSDNTGGYVILVRGG